MGIVEQDLIGDWAANKKPKRTRDMQHWRWVLVEHGGKEGPHDLPEPVFNQLRSDERQPWLFKSSLDATIAFVNAIKAAYEAGWVPKEAGDGGQA